MGIKRATFFFECGRYGFSETFFADADKDLAVLFDAVKDKVFIGKRMELAGNSTYLRYIRVSDDTVRGDSLIYAPTTLDGVGTTGNSDIANTAIITRLQAATPNYTFRKVWFVRGIPDDCVRNGGDFFNFGGWINKFKNFIQALQQAGLGLRVASVPNPRLIAGIAAGPAQGLVVVSAALGIGATVLPPNNIVRVGGLRGFRGIRGNKKVIATNGTTTVTISTTGFLPTWTAGGTVGLVVPAFQAITDGQVIRVAERKAGRVFGSPVGRARAR